MTKAKNASGIHSITIHCNGKVTQSSVFTFTT